MPPAFLPLTVQSTLEAMIRPAFSFVVFLSLSAAFATEPAVPPVVPAGDLKARLAAIQVCKDLGVEEAHDVLPLSVTKGVTLTFSVASPTRTLLGVLENPSECLSFTDDKGTDFRPSAKFESGGGMHPFRYGAIQVFSPTIPAAGASRISFKGKIVALCGSEPKTEDYKDVELRKGAAITVGSLVLTVAEAETKKGHFRLKLEAREELNAITEMVFLDQADQPLTWTQSEDSQGEDQAKQAVSGREFQFASAIDHVTFRITYYSKLERIGIPVNCSVGVDLTERD